MYTKSTIQQIIDTLHLKNSFKYAIESLMNKYNIEDSVFVFKNNSMKEVVEGYFVTEKQFDNIAEAISNCDINTMGVRVMGNTFQIGKICSTISECDTNKNVFDLKRLTDVR
jgi:hypothetical protein